jgi:hypothetical protein
MSGDAGARAPAQDEPRDLIRASIRARAVAASTVWRVPACNSSIAARRSSRRPGVASRSASASAETQLSSGIEYTTGLNVALRVSRRTTEIARPGRISAQLRDDAGRLARWYSPTNETKSPPSPMTTGRMRSSVASFVLVGVITHPGRGGREEPHGAVAAADDRASWKATTRTTSAASS